MASAGYDEVLRLLKQGAAAEAQAQFNALHETAIAMPQQDARHKARNHAPEPASGSSRESESADAACYLIENGRKTGPFCRHCHDTKAQWVRLRALNAATYVCPSCTMATTRDLCG